VTKLTVGLGGQQYDILIEPGLLGQVASAIRPYTTAGSPVAVVTDENVWGYYGQAFIASLQSAGITARPQVLPPGEQNKSLAGLAGLYDAFTEMKLRRNGLVVALGGGVIGDLAGFAAATYLRGIPYVQVPTSLLAQVDSSVGGKTAIDLAQGKNLVGSYYQPKLVLIDPDALLTLPVRELRCGMAEIIKYGAIRSRKLFDELDVPAAGISADNIQGNAPGTPSQACTSTNSDAILALGTEVSTVPRSLNVAALSTVIADCCSIKAGIVSRDERDEGERMLLNFGHTFGHAIEKAYDFERFNHGEAVAIGMVLAARIGQELGITPAAATEELCRLLGAHGLDTSCPCRPSSLLEILETDKKSSTSWIQMVLLRKIGDALIQPLSFDELGDIVRSVEGKWTR